MTLKEIDWAIIDCYRSFYMGKLKELMSMKDEFKRQYLFRSMKLIMSSSFIVDKLGALGSMPPQVEALMNKLKAGDDAEKRPPRPNLSRVAKSVRIHAPLPKVFSYVSSPSNWTRFVTSLTDVRNLSSGTIAEGTTFEWTYRMLGINFDGKGAVTAFHPNRTFSMTMNGPFPIEETYRFERDGDHTMLTVTVAYEVPGKVLGAVANRLVVEKINAREAEAVLKKIKTICEAEKI
jgi:ligand-binding SRPBCC domain-containing protein